MKNSFEKDLKKQLPLLERENIIDRETSDKILTYYQTRLEQTSGNTALTIVGSLAALLIGAGIILLFAYNWSSIPVWTRTGLSFIPLLGSQYLVFYSWKKSKRSSWIEFSSLFLTLSVGSVIALISQIYQIPGDLENFLLTWMLLILPLIYLTGSIGAMSVYLTGILFWSGYSQALDGNALFYWILLGAVIPQLMMLIKKEKSSNKTAIISWLIAFNLLIGTGISLEKVLPGLWILIYSLLLIFFYLCGEVYYRDSPGGFSAPFNRIGTTGIVLLSYLFTFQYFWEDIGLNNIRREWGKSETLAVFDYVILLILLISVLYLLFLKIEKMERYNMFPYAGIFILALISFIAGSIDDGVLLQIILFNAYTIFLGGWIIYRGIKSSQLYQINMGMLTVLLIIITRFFDMEIGFTIKGIIFIFLGILFLIINKYLGKAINSREGNL